MDSRMWQADFPNRDPHLNCKKKADDPGHQAEHEQDAAKKFQGACDVCEIRGEALLRKPGQPLAGRAEEFVIAGGEENGGNSEPEQEQTKRFQFIKHLHFALQAARHYRPLPAAGKYRRLVQILVRMLTRKRVEESNTLMDRVEF